MSMWTILRMSYGGCGSFSSVARRARSNRRMDGVGVFAQCETCCGDGVKFGAPRGYATSTSRSFPVQTNPSRTITTLVFGSLFAFAALGAHAASVYKCRGADGAVAFQDHACAAGA